VLDAHDAVVEQAGAPAPIEPIVYRPFDSTFMYYDDDVVWRTARKVSLPMLRPNLALVSGRQGQVVGSMTWNLAFVANAPVDFNFFYRGGGHQLLLYDYPDEAAGQTDAFAAKHRTLNLEPKIYAVICQAAGIDPADQAGPDDDFRAATGDARPSEVKVFDYIYGVLHSPDYRRTFAELLKIDFPRVPYPSSAEIFRHVSEKGEALRRLHLMEPAAIGEAPYRFEGEGDDMVASGFPKFEGGKVMINDDQCFADVPQVAWDFHIGGYQPAQKWLKDRRGRTLSWDDIGHYQRIVKILVETDRIMKEIELPLGTA
jgi:predicted helicase